MNQLNANLHKHFLNNYQRTSFSHCDISGNNSVSYTQRVALGSQGILNVSPTRVVGHMMSIVMGGSLGDLIGDQVVFEEVIDGKLVSACGLSELCVGFLDSTQMLPCCIVDNHNRVFPIIVDSLRALGSDPPLLIHIDQHADMNFPDHHIDLKSSSFGVLRDYAIHQTTIASWIQPLLFSGIISEVLQIRSGYALNHIPLSSGAIKTTTQYVLHPKNQKPTPYRLDIDVDFWMPEAGYSAEECSQHRDIVAKLMQGAIGVSIATSPCFIDQEYALSVIQQLFTRISRR